VRTVRSEAFSAAVFGSTSEAQGSLPMRRAAATNASAVTAPGPTSRTSGSEEDSVIFK